MRASRKSIEEQYQLVLACRQSGLSDHNWCMENDIKPGTFYSWIKRLRGLGTYDFPDPVSSDCYEPNPKQDIVKVEFVEKPTVQIPKPTIVEYTEDSFSFQPSLELHIGTSSLLVSNEVSPTVLEQAIRLLSEVASC